MKRLETKKQDATLMGLGLLLAVLLCVPYVILGEKSVITYHDQLDGELITYLLNAKHLFQGLSVYPEVMGGIPKNGMVSPAPLYVLLYKILPPFPAFFCMMLLNKLVAFSFTYLLIRKGSERKLPAFAVAAWFTALPFYPRLWSLHSGAANAVLCHGAASGKGRARQREMGGVAFAGRALWSGVVSCSLRFCRFDQSFLCIGLGFITGKKAGSLLRGLDGGSAGRHVSFVQSLFGGTAPWNGPGYLRLP